VYDNSPLSYRAVRMLGFVGAVYPCIRNSVFPFFLLLIGVGILNFSAKQFYLF